MASAWSDLFRQSEAQRRASFARRWAEAETAYREDLVRNPENGWSLSGLAAALDAQGKTSEAEGVRKRLEKAWALADVPAAGSR